MPALTYPGVYIQEIPSGINPITGVATSIAAFVGWANQGPTDEAVLVQSWSDFQSQFGGLISGNYLGYAVNQFFASGGQQAYIVRIVWDGTLPPAAGSAPVPSATAFAAGVGIATSVISATYQGVTGSTLLTVGSPVLESISITPGAPPWITSGQTLQFAATGNYSDTSTPVITSTVTWTSSDTAVALIAPSGLVSPVAAGTTVITATLGAISNTVELSVSAASMTGISVTPAAVSLAAGLTQQFTATANYSDTTTQDLTNFAAWASSAAAATIDATTGLATAVSTGPTNVTAAWNSVTSPDAVLTVTAAVLESLVVTPINPTISTGGALTFSALGNYTNSTTPQALTGSAAPSWTSSNHAAATIDGTTGVVTVVGAGTTVITATSGSVILSTTLTVTAQSLLSIAIGPAALTVAAGQTLQLTATGTYGNGTTQDMTGFVEWSSSDTSLATVTATRGLVTGVAVGTPKITASWNGVSTDPTLTVSAALLASIALSPLNPSIANGATQQFTATGTYTDGTSQVLLSPTWGSSVQAVTTINSSGLATAISGGDTLTLFASNPGAWANSIQIVVTLQPGNATRFGLQVQTTSGAVLENYANLSTNPNDPQGQYVVTVIDNDSSYVTFINPKTGLAVVPSGPPAATSAPVVLGGGVDGTALQPATDGNFELALGINPPATTFGVHLLDRVSIFNLLCVPGETDQATIVLLQGYCAGERAFYIVDCPQTATTAGLASTGPVGTALGGLAPTPGLICGSNSINSAYYYPWILAPDPLFGNRNKLFPPCGFVAGIYASTDANQGVWKAPAGIGASVSGSGLQYVLTDAENGSLNPQAINCFRQFNTYGDVVWGARTLQGSDAAGSQWKYVPIKRLALFLESSLYDGTQWVVFEPNAEPLWSQIRLNVGTFMQGLFLQGAFAGTTPQQAYFVKCDSENNPQSSIDLGIVYILVGFAPLYPAEFVVVQIQQMAGQTLS